MRAGRVPFAHWCICLVGCRGWGAGSSEKTRSHSEVCVKSVWKDCYS